MSAQLPNRTCREMPAATSRTPSAKFAHALVFRVPIRPLITVTKRTVRLLPLSTAVLRSGGFPGASEGALSPWHRSRTLWSCELNQQNGQADRAQFTAHTKHISPELDLSYT